MRSSFYEQALDRQGVQWRYIKNLAMDEINLDRSKNNQVRLTQPVIPELVTQYAGAMRAGDRFPPVVVHRIGKGKYNLLDGVNRTVAAIEARRSYVDAYEISSATPVAALARLRATFNNAVNGQRMSYDDLMWHAIEMVRLRILALEVAAKECGVKRHDLASRVKEAELREVLDSHNISNRNIGRDRLIDLRPVKDFGVDLFCRVAKLVDSTGAACEDVKDIVRDVKRAKNHSDKIAVIKDWEKSDKLVTARAETKGGTIKRKSPPPKHRMSKLLRDMDRLLGLNQDAALKPTGGDWRQARESAAMIVDRLTIMFGLGVVTTARKERAS
jgi:hypothetical protein